MTCLRACSVLLAHVAIVATSTASAQSPPKREEPVVSPSRDTASPQRTAMGAENSWARLPVLGMALTKEDASSSDAAGSSGGEKKDDSKSGDEKKKAGDSASSAQPASSEQDGKLHYSVGARLRFVVIPQFMFNLFGADGGATVISPSFGPELAVRRKNFEYDVWLTFATYGMDDAPFKAKSDPDIAYEKIRTDLKTLSIGSDFLWAIEMGSDVEFLYGGAFGLGVVFGDIYRNQAYPRNGVPGDPANYQKCAAPGNPNANYCGNDNEHYADYKEPSWVSGGSKPIVFPWIAIPQVGVRWKPSPSFGIRFDTGLSFPGPFFFGLAGHYNLL